MKMYQILIMQAALIGLMIWSIVTIVNGCTEAIADGSAGKAIGGFVKDVRESAE